MPFTLCLTPRATSSSETTALFKTDRILLAKVDDDSLIGELRGIQNSKKQK